jgi:hypothetical protein
MMALTTDCDILASGSPVTVPSHHHDYPQIQYEWEEKTVVDCGSTEGHQYVMVKHCSWLAVNSHSNAANDTSVDVTNKLALY